MTYHNRRYRIPSVFKHCLTFTFFVFLTQKLPTSLAPKLVHDALQILQRQAWAALQTERHPERINHSQAVL